MRAKEPTGIYLLLILEHLMNPLLSPLLRPTEVLLQLGRLFLLSFLCLLPEAADNLRRPQHRGGDTQRCRATSGTGLPGAQHPPQGASGEGGSRPTGRHRVEFRPPAAAPRGSR